MPGSRGTGARPEAERPGGTRVRGRRQGRGEAVEQRAPGFQASPCPFDARRRDELQARGAGSEDHARDVAHVQLGDSAQLFETNAGDRVRVGVGLVACSHTGRQLKRELPLKRSLGSDQPQEVAQHVAEEIAAARCERIAHLSDARAAPAPAWSGLFGRAAKASGCRCESGVGVEGVTASHNGEHDCLFRRHRVERRDHACHRLGRLAVHGLD